MSDSVRLHRRQPTRLPCPWDSPGKNTRMGCHFLLQCRKVKSESEVAESCLTLSDPMDCGPPGSSIHGIFQARLLEWGATGVTGKFGLGVQNEAGQMLIEFCQENVLVTANTLFQQHKKSLYTWTSPDGQHGNQIDYIVCSQRWRKSIQSAKQDWELPLAQLMSSLLSNSDLN